MSRPQRNRGPKKPRKNFIGRAPFNLRLRCVVDTRAHGGCLIAKPNPFTNYHTMIFLDFPTELLCRILSYLPAVDLCAAKLTCHLINRIVTDTIYFQYTLRAHINGVHDLLPPDYPFHDRIELLKQYEKSWNNLQLDKTTSFPIHIEAPNLDRYTLQDGYLIYVSDQQIEQQIERGYSYLDLFSTIGNKEASWVHIPMPMQDNGVSMQPPNLIFAADHNLGISLRFRILPSAFINAIPDDATAYRGWPAHLHVHNPCFPSSSLLPGHPIRSPQSMSYGFPRSPLILYPLSR